MEFDLIVEYLREHLHLVMYALPFLAGIVSLAARGELQSFARQTVAAVYRAAIRAAAELQDEGLQWLRSADGIAYRKDLAGRAYDMLPAKVGMVPVGVVKLVVSRDAFVAFVERAFQEVVELAEELELDERLNPVH